MPDSRHPGELAVLTLKTFKRAQPAHGPGQHVTNQFRHGRVVGHVASQAW